MRLNTIALRTLPLVAALGASISVSALAQTDQTAPRTDILVTGQRLPNMSEMTEGPEIKGIIVARKGGSMKVRTADGNSTVIAFDDQTQLKTGGGFLGAGRAKVGKEALMNGLPVAVKTMQWTGGLFARQITFQNKDLRFANMIHNGTDQRFNEQAAATEALRSRMGDIDNYNVKSTMNVNFDTGKAALSPDAKANLCTVATEAQGIDNALLLVVGYTDSTGSEDFNQTLSEKRASSVINYLQQACKWKPYRMLTPTGMAASDPLADNMSAEGRAQNRRVSVNVLVSKAVDGL